MSKQVEVIVGWTKSDVERDEKGRAVRVIYSPFCDGYKPGASQHTESMTLTVADHWDIERVAEAVFVATNAPHAHVKGSPEEQVYDALVAVDYRGQGAHYSLSTGDTVTVDGHMVECSSVGWKVVDPHDTVMSKDEADMHGWAVDNT